MAMTRLEGEPIERLLPELSAREAQQAMRQLGRTVAALHAVDPTGVTCAVSDFDALLAHQARDILAIEGRRGCPEPWLSQLDRFVASTQRGASRGVLLHTEIGPGHSLLASAGSLGIIDWAETLVGDAEYDLAAVAFFIARGDGELLGAFLDGYGWSGPVGEILARSLLRYLLLHRYAPFAWLIEQRPPTAQTLFELASAWMGSV